MLFRQICILAAIAGLFAGREPVQGTFLLAAVLFLAFPRHFKLTSCLVLLAAFSCGFFYMQVRENKIPVEPDWLTQSLDLKKLEDGRERRPPSIRIKAEVESVTPLPDNRLRIILGKPRPDNQPGAVPYAGSIVWTWQNPAFSPRPGDSIAADLPLARIRDFENPGAWGVERFWLDQNVFIRSWSRGDKAQADLSPESDPSATLVLRDNLRERFINNLAGQGKDGLSSGQAILLALIFGDRSFITPHDRDLFADATLAHSLALSGLHMGYMAAFGFALALLISRLIPGISFAMPRPMLALTLSLPFAVLYLWLGQYPISLSRAFLMLIFWWLLLLWRHPKVILDGLLAALAILLLIDPASLFSISLQLSAMSVAVIAVCLPWALALAERLFPEKRGGAGKKRPGRFRAKCRSLLRGACTMMVISFSIQIVLSPLIIKTFGTVGLWFPLNLLWLPILGVWVMPLAFAGLFCTMAGLDSPAHLSLYLAALPGDLLIDFLNFLDQNNLLAAPAAIRPHWLSMAGFWILCLAIPAMLLRRKDLRKKAEFKGLLAAGLAGCLLVFGPLCAGWLENQNTEVRMRMIDVGQGQAVCIEWSGISRGSDGDLPSHGRVLVDGGGFASSSFDVGRAVVAPVLTDNSRARLDAVINTHPDTDHLGGLLYILEKFQVGAFYANGDSVPPSLAGGLDKILANNDIQPRLLSAGDVLPLARNLFLEVLWPPAADTAGEDPNFNSIVLRLIWEGKPLALLCADIDKSALRNMLKTHRDVSCQVLILPHHGSKSSFLPAFYEAAAPKLALASCGYGNPWGFPSPAVRNALENLSIPLHTTARDGQILLKWTAPDQSPAISFGRSLAGDMQPKRSFGCSPASLKAR